VETISPNCGSAPYQFQSVKCNFLLNSSLPSLHVSSFEKYHSQQTTLHGRLFACFLFVIESIGIANISLMHEIESEEKIQEFLDYYICLIERCAHVDIGIILQQLLNINR
jgi:hypothetical protein